MKTVGEYAKLALGIETGLCLFLLVQQQADVGTRLLSVLLAESISLLYERFGHGHSRHLSFN